jgi:cob(I)alamin adenosyltransferase
MPEQNKRGLVRWFKSRCRFATQNDLREMEQRIMATQAELAADLRAVLAQQKKTSAEIAVVQTSVDTLKAKIAELEAVIAGGGEASPELVAAVAEVKAQAQVVDDQLPDATPEPPA